MKTEYQARLWEACLDNGIFERVKGVVKEIIKAERAFQRKKDKRNLEGVKRRYRREIEAMIESGRSIEEVRREMQTPKWKESKYDHNL